MGINGNIKSETYEYSLNTTSEVYGTSGPLKVSFARPEFDIIAQEFLRIATEYDPARRVTDDINAPRTVDEYSVSCNLDAFRDHLTQCSIAMAKVHRKGNWEALGHCSFLYLQSN